MNIDELGQKFLVGSQDHLIIRLFNQKTHYENFGRIERIVRSGMWRTVQPFRNSFSINCFSAVINDKVIEDVINQKSHINVRWVL